MVVTLGVYSVVATLWCRLWVSTLGVYSGCLLCDGYSVVATLRWLVCVATLGVILCGGYSVVATLGGYSGCLLMVSTLSRLLCMSTLGVDSVVATLRWLLCGG